MQNPEKGAVIARAGGLRKVRMALAGMGKRGGARIIYLRMPEYQTVVFFYLYTKGEMDDLDSKQLRRLREAVEIIKKEFRDEK